MEIKSNCVCVLCGNNGYKVIYKIKESVFGKEYFKIVKCSKCGLVYTIPQPLQENIGKYYPDDYYSFIPYYPIPFLPAENKNIFKKIKNFIKKCVLKEIYGYPFNNCSSSFIFNFFSKYLAKMFKFQIGWVFPEYIKSGKVLDVGCGSGIFFYQN